MKNILLIIFLFLMFGALVHADGFLNNNCNGGSGGSGVSGVSSNNFALGSGSTSLTTSNLYQKNNNVGVGSQNPGALLDVNGNFRAQFIYGDISHATGVTGSISGLTTNILPKASSSTTIGDSQISDNGTNVGISSTTPRQKLDVNGSIQATSVITAATNNPQVDLYPQLSSDTHWILGVNGDGGNDNDDNFVLSEGTTLGTNNRITIAPGGLATIPNISTAAIANTGGYTQSGTTANIFTGTPTFSNATYSALFSGGNVGIGTATPSSKLSIVGNVNISGTTSEICGTGAGSKLKCLNLETANSWDFYLQNGTYAQHLLMDLDGTSGSAVITGSGGLNTVNFSGLTVNASYFTGDVSSATGKGVGIGTVNAPAVYVGIGTLGPANNIYFTGGNIGIGVPSPIYSLDTTGPIRSTSVGNSYFPGGNVGIGTISAGARLSVIGGNVGIGTDVAPNALYVVGTPMFTTGLNIGIGTASPTRLCIANNAVTICP